MVGFGVFKGERLGKPHVESDRETEAEAVCSGGVFINKRRRAYSAGCWRVMRSCGVGGSFPGN